MWITERMPEEAYDVAAHMTARGAFILRAAGTGPITPYSVDVFWIWLIIAIEVVGGGNVILSCIMTMFDFHGMKYEVYNVGMLLMGLSSIGNALGLLLHWRNARRMRYRQTVARPNRGRTDLHLKRLLWWTGPALTLSIVLGLAAAGFVNIDYTVAIISAVSIVGYVPLSLPHLATSLIMQADFETLSVELEGAVTASNDVNYDGLLQVEESIKRANKKHGRAFSLGISSLKVRPLLQL